MSAEQWILIGLLALASYGIRLVGLLGGQAIAADPRLRPLLEDLPGCLLVGLIAASLAQQPPTAWIAALVALGVAVVSNNVVVTMAAGFLAIFGLGLLSGAA